MNNQASMHSTFSTHGIPVDSAPVSSQDCCPVCLENMFDRHSVVKTACNHRVHEDCIMAWLTTKNEDTGLLQRTCMICRSPVVPMMREQVPVGWKETNRLVEPEALRAVQTGHPGNLTNALSRDPGVVHQCYQTNLSGEPGKKVYLLYIAAMKGNSNMVSQLLDAGAKVNATQQTDGQQNGWTALMVAAREGHADVVARLLEAGAKVNAANLIERRNFEKVKRTALKKAIENKRADIVTQLLKAGAKPGYSHLMTAVKNRQTDLVTQLLKAGAKPGYSHLMTAVKNRQTDLVTQLLKAGAKPGYYHLMTAVENRQADIARNLLKARYYLADLSQPLFEAVCNGDTEIVRLILSRVKNKADTKLIIKYALRRQQFYDGLCSRGRWPALMVAVRLGHYEIVKLLLTAGAKVNVKNKTNPISIVGIAARNGRSDILQLLIDYKAEVNPAKNKDGKKTTPLHWAAYQDHPDCFKILIANGADINAINVHGDSVLDVARPSCKKILLNKEQYSDSHKEKTC